jgi:hypothetical protein
LVSLQAQAQAQVQAYVDLAYVDLAYVDFPASLQGEVEVVRSREVVGRGALEELRAVALPLSFGYDFEGQAENGL